MHINKSLLYLLAFKLIIFFNNKFNLIIITDEIKIKKPHDVPDETG